MDIRWLGWKGPSSVFYLHTMWNWLLPLKDVASLLQLAKKAIKHK